MDGQYRVFFGVGLSEDDASDIATQLEDEGLDVYLKDDLSCPVRLAQRSFRSTKPDVKTVGTGWTKGGEPFGCVIHSGGGRPGHQRQLRRDMESIERSHLTSLTAFGKRETALPDEQRQAVQVMDQIFGTSGGSNSAV